MIVTCNDDYWKYMESMKPAEAPCGKTYDDVDRLTICPHDLLPPKMTEGELNEAMRSLGIVLPTDPSGADVPESDGPRHLAPPL